MKTMRIAVLVTCYNRVEKTLKCLDCVEAQQTHPNLVIDVYVTDAGSVDGTPEALAIHYPNTRIVRASSDVYWNRGMHIAFRTASRHDYDFYLWLNDDTYLDSNAIQRAIETWTEVSSVAGSSTIVVGSTRDGRTGAISYGGYRKAGGLNPLKFVHIDAPTEALKIDTMNGNFVLLSRSTVDLIGNLDWAFSHSIGDFDYGLRAVNAGCAIWLMTGTIGSCERNAIANTWQDPTIPRAVRWRMVRSPKGLPPAEWFRFCRRHGGARWMIPFLAPYLRAFRPHPRRT